MSFRNPFKQHGSSLRRAAITKTEEREFESEFRKLSQLDEDTKKIYKDTKKCIDCLTAQSKAENKLVHTLYNSQISRENAELRYVTDTWFQCTQQLDLMSQEMNASQSKTVAEPMKKFSSIFPSLQQQLKRREQVLQELNKCQARVDKYTERERTGPNIVKMEANKKALKTAKAEFDSINDPLKVDMPKLFEGRTTYFEPSFQALIKSEIKYFTEAHKVYTTLADIIRPQNQPEISNPFTVDDDEDDNPRPSQLEQKLANIRSLSITLDDR